MTTMETTVTTAQVYQLYIKATPEQVWDAITKPEFVKQYFHGALVESTYEVGSKVRSWSPDHETLWTDNTVLEFDPPRRYVHSWISLYDPETAKEEESRVSWEIDPTDAGYCKLTVVHDKLEGAPKTAANVSGGWMFILSGLKTLCETGKPLVA